MSSSDPPEFEKSVYTYEDRPVLATMLSGGFFIGLVLYFIMSRIMRNMSFLGSNLVPSMIFIFIIIMSFLGARGFDVQITINTKSGWIQATSKTQYWEGYAHQTKSFLVLQRERSVTEDTSLIEYKLHLELDDNSKYEIPLNKKIAIQAINVIDKANSAIPVKTN